MDTAQEERDVVMILTGEHREIQQMIDTLTEAGIGDARNITAVVDEMVIELARHLSATERCLHPAVQRYVTDGAGLVERQDAQNAQIRHSMKRVTGADPAESGFGRELAQLVTAVRTHVAGEEEHIFAELSAACPPDRLHQLGAAVASVERSGPTRSHPSAPHRPPLNAITDPVLGLLDKARDRADHRGSFDV